MTGVRDHPSYPRCGAGAAILDPAGRLLLVKRLHEPEAGAWGLPGGRIEFGERATEAVRREVAEELGIIIDILGLACIAETIDRGNGGHWVAPVYLARLQSGTPSIREPDKHGGWGWFDLKALPAALTTPTVAFLNSRPGR